MRELWERYLHEMKSNGDKLATWQCRAYWANIFQGYGSQNDLVLADLTREQLEAYLQWLLWTPLPTGRLRSPNTVYQGMRMLRHFLRWAVSEGGIDADPTAGWVFGKPTTRTPMLLSRAQLESLFNAPNANPIGQRNRAVLQTIAELGLYSERCSLLNLADLDLVGYQLQGLKLSAHLAELFHSYLRHARPALLTNPAEPALFLGRFGGRLTPEAVEFMLADYTRGHRVSPRTLRRSWLAHRDAFLNRRLPGT